MQRGWLSENALRIAGVTAALGCLAYFVAYFDEARFQPSVELAWLFATSAWTVAFWRSTTSTSPGLRQPYWLYVLYGVILLFFATDWRWAMTADNMSWPLGGIIVSKHGIGRSPLSANGADNFGYLQMLLHDAFMFLVSPTLFWHRVGKIVVGVLAMAAVYTAFARLVSSRFGILVAACSASTSVWIVYTYASVPFMDGIAFAYTIVAVGLWISREPSSRKAWLTLGLLSGLMLFFTPNSWPVALFVWGYLAVLLLLRRWSLIDPLVAAATALIAGLPMLIQWGQGEGGQLFSLVQNPGWTTEKVVEFLRQAAFIPFESDIQGAGAFGPQLPAGFRWLFIPGVLLTPWFRRFPAARLIFFLHLSQVLFLAFAQGPYVAVSVKRALILIPTATYFAFLPFHRYLRSLPLVLVIVAAWASLGVYDVATRMQPGRTGYTLLDGVIEANQRFADAPVCVYVHQRSFVEHWAPGTNVDRLYGLSPHVTQVLQLDDPACRQVLCYSPQIDTVDLAALGYTEVKMLNSVELRCGRKGTP